MGDEVRFDGGHKRQEWIEELQKHCDLMPLCPEAGGGLGTPRPPVRLVTINKLIHAVGVDDACLDVTDALMDYADSVMPELNGLDAYIFKARSPSCGVGSAEITRENNTYRGYGLFAQQVKNNFPDLLLLEEDEVADWLKKQSFSH